VVKVLLRNHWLKEEMKKTLYILLDCITIMVSNIILEKCIDWNILPEKG